MNKTYLIFRHEFLLAIKRVGFIILTLAIPVLALLAIGIGHLAAGSSETPVENILHVGYVDELGILEETVWEGWAAFLPFDSKANATRALASYEISTFIVVPEDYLSSGIIQRFTLENEHATAPAMLALIKRFISVNLLKDQVPTEIANLVVSPLNLQVSRITAQGEQELEQMPFTNVIIPGVFALLLSLGLMFGVIALVNSLGEEKESRLIEVLFSSVSVRQLLIAKLLALGLAGLLQVLFWLISAPLLLQLASSLFNGWLSEIRIPENFILLGIIYFVLGYMLFAVLSIGVGAITPTAREGSNLSMAYVMLSFVPLWFLSFLFAFPNGTFSVILTLFPITAPIQNMVRLGVTQIPLWQILTSLGLLILSIGLGMYLSIKLFRIYMLSHGKRPGLKTIMRHFRSA